MQTTTVRKTRARKTPKATPVVVSTLPYQDYESNDIAFQFRSIDARQGRRPGLINAMRIVDDYYYSGECARQWRQVLGELLAEA